MQRIDTWHHRGGIEVEDHRLNTCYFAGVRRHAVHREIARIATLDGTAHENTEISPGERNIVTRDRRVHSTRFSPQ
jgi:hypothetical protein